MVTYSNTKISKIIIIIRVISLYWFIVRHSVNVFEVYGVTLPTLGFITRVK